MEVRAASRSVEEYRGIGPPGILDEIATLARRLRGARVLHVSSTATGGGVAELLRFLVPFLRDAGVDARWWVIEGTEEFFHVTKALHNGLQGAPIGLDDAMRVSYVEVAHENAAALPDGFDLAVVHDPQPAALASIRPEIATRWAWRCHVDSSMPDPLAWDFLGPYIEHYDAAIFTLEAFVPPGFPEIPVTIEAPAIDALSSKNAPLARSEVEAICGRLDLPLDAPLVAQVSRFDRWKDPLGVIEAHRLARRAVPDSHLALVGGAASDDPDGAAMRAQVVEAARGDPQVHVLPDLADVEVNAVQRASRVVVQKSLREGFGLVVSEALWKGTPVVGGRTGGIPLQIGDGVAGALVDDVAGCAEAVARLLRDPVRARALGEAGRERVRERFLAPRLVRDELRVVDVLRGSAGYRP